MTSGVERSSQASAAGPDEVRHHVVVRGENETRGAAGLARPGPPAPELQLDEDPPTDALMMPVELFRHVQVPVDDLVACPVDLRQTLQIAGRESHRAAHRT